MFKKITNWYKSRIDGHKLKNWFQASWDEEFIYRTATPPGKEAWNDKFRWLDINRICFNATDYMLSDEIIFCTTERPEGYIVPIEAKGGEELWTLVLDKNLFDADQALLALTSPEGLFCWPEIEKSPDES